MSDAVVALIERWRCRELVGILMCEAIAGGTRDAERRRRWLTMARIERRMHAEIVGHLGAGGLVASVGTNEPARIAERLAQDYLAHGPLAGAGRMAVEARALLDELRSDVAALDTTMPLVKRLIQHEEIWIDFLMWEAAGDSLSAEDAALQFLRG